MQKIANQPNQRKHISAPGAPISRAETLNNRREALSRYIQAGIEADPVEHNGSLWVTVRQSDLADTLGIPLPSLKRLIKMPPFVRTAKGLGDAKRTLMRLGEPEVEDPQKRIANTMSKMWRQNRGWELTPASHYGPLLGLARVLPEGWQIKIFKHAVNFWGEFVTLTRGFIEKEQLLREAGMRTNDRISVHPDDYEASYAAYDSHDYIAADFHGAPLMIRKVKFPSPAYLLRFHKIASSMFVRHWKKLGIAYPEEVWW